MHYSGLCYYKEGNYPLADTVANSLMLHIAIFSTCLVIITLIICSHSPVLFKLKHAIYMES
jgi:hypothetical protein